ncbi:MAG: response regulator, partial [Myxococcales bacterium]|nr:response regulator [Myxococcales bacterium]
MSLYFTQLSLSFLIQSMCGLALVLYLYSLRDKETPTRMLLGFVAGFTALSVCMFLSASTLSATPAKFYVEIAMDLSITLAFIPWIQFAYHFTTIEGRQLLASRVALFVTIAVFAVAGVGNVVHRSIFGHTPAHTEVINVATLVTTLWSIVVLLRHSARISAHEPRSLWRRLWRPRARQARAAQRYAVFFSLTLLPVVTLVLESAGALPDNASESLFSLGMLLAFSGFGLTYVNHSHKPTTFMVKLIGIMLFTLVVAFGLIAFTVQPHHEAAYFNQHPQIDGRALHLQRAPDGGLAVRPAATERHEHITPRGRRLAIVGDESVALPLEFEFPLFSQRWRELHVNRRGVVCFGGPFSGAAYNFAQQTAITPALLDMDETVQATVLVESSPDQITITWSGLVSESQPRPVNLQTVLSADGSIALRHDPLASRGVLRSGVFPDFRVGPTRTLPSASALPDSLAPNTGVVVDYDHDFRRFVHERMTPLVYLLFGMCLVILLIFPLFLRANLVAPLNALVAGVRAVQRGDLNIEVPVQFNDEVGFLTHSFNRTIASIRSADKLKDEFLANTSHELRTPLHGIIGIAESLLDGVGGELSAIQQNNLEMVVVAGKRLAHLVDDILDFSKLKNHDLTLHTRPIDLFGVTEVVLMISRPLAQQKPLEIVNEIDPELPQAHADENRVQQILYNLVGNAIKFTAAGRVAVSARVVPDAPPPGVISVTVSDTGIGIAASEQKRIFRSFTQAQGDTVRAYGGTGLGLSISKKLVELLGGRLTVESQPGHGSRFTFTLPLAKPGARSVAPARQRGLLRSVPPQRGGAPRSEAPPAEPDEARIEANAQFHILVVDDESINRQVLQNHLALHGYAVTLARDGAEALAMIEDERRFDLVVLDVMMPRISGYEVCAKIRERYPAYQLPVVMLTARNQVTDLVAGFRVGGNDYLTKPFSREELLTRLRLHLNLAKVNVAYGRFVPRQILEYLDRESIVDVQLGDQTEREMTVLFADVRGFTSLSEQMTPKQNFDFINALLGEVGPVVREHHGFVDKYIGDAIMALFPRGADDAVRGAIAIQHQLH